MAYLGRLGRLLVIYVKSFAFALFIITVVYLVYSTPSYNDKECLPLNPRRSNIRRLCKSIMTGNKKVTAYASQFAWCRRSDYVSEDYYISKLSNVSSECNNFLSKNGYLSYNITAEERSFPLAFSILIHENIEQVTTIAYYIVIRAVFILVPSVLGGSESVEGEAVWVGSGRVEPKEHRRREDRGAFVVGVWGGDIPSPVD